MLMSSPGYTLRAGRTPWSNLIFKQTLTLQGCISLIAMYDSTEQNKGHICDLFLTANAALCVCVGRSHVLRADGSVLAALHVNGGWATPHRATILIRRADSPTALAEPGQHTQKSVESLHVCQRVQCHFQSVYINISISHIIHSLCCSGTTKFGTEPESSPQDNSNINHPESHYLWRFDQNYEMNLSFFRRHCMHITSQVWVVGGGCLSHSSLFSIIYASTHVGLWVAKGAVVPFRAVLIGSNTIKRSGWSMRFGQPQPDVGKNTFVCRKTCTKASSRVVISSPSTRNISWLLSTFWTTT